MLESFKRKEIDLATTIIWFHIAVIADSTQILNRLLLSVS